MSRPQLLALGAIMVASPALAGTPSVGPSAVGQAIAVMPFRDLMATGTKVGEAIREVVTSDLKEVAGLKVLERGRIDQVIAEQDLTERRTDLDAISAVRLGTLLGATMLVTGAYQRSAGTVRLTARLVRVQSGEIVGTAKVDGPIGDLLQLEDQIASVLLRSAGLARAPGPFRGKLRSWRAVELYGDAVVEHDDDKRRALLRRVVAEDPGLVYAVKDLDALERRMAGYGEIASRKLAADETATLGRIRDKKRPAAERARLGRGLIAELLAARRYRTLEQVLTTLVGIAAELDEETLYARFVVRDRLHRVDAALTAGEAYGKALPTGAHFREIEARMGEIAELRRKREARVVEYERDLVENQQRCLDARGQVRPDKRVEYDFTPCIAARWNNQVNDRMLKGCSAFLDRHARDPDPEARDHVVAARFFVILALDAAGEFERARPLAADLARDTGEWREELQQLTSAWPTD
jgi:TolB-like protein